MEPLGRYEFRSIVPGIETLPPRLSRPRHHHREGYATVVLAGTFTEVSFAGRMEAEPADVLLHGSFDCHLDVARSRGPLQILRLPWRTGMLEGKFRVRDPDALARLAEVDIERAASQLHCELLSAPRRDPERVDDLASALAGDCGFRLQEWADRRGLRGDVLSRVFRREFGVSAQRFRLESRTRLAWRQVLGSARSLTEIALQAGFSDLAHMSRSIRVFTGRSPTAWRLSSCPGGASAQKRSSAPQVCAAH